MSGSVVLSFFEGTPDGCGFTFENPTQMARYFYKNSFELIDLLSINQSYYVAEMFIGAECCGKVFKSHLEIKKDFYSSLGYAVKQSAAERYFAEAEAWLIAEVLAAPAGKSKRSGRL